MPALLVGVVPGADLGADVVATLALLALVATAYRHPGPRTEALVALGATAVTLAVALPAGLIGWSTLGETLARLLPVVAFLLAILVVADVCARAGLFDAAAARVVGLAGGRPTRLLVGVFVLAAAVTVVFSLDATAVLLTPVVLLAAGRVGTTSRPGTVACLRMANSASLLLPVSNLTNLLALPDLHLTFTGFAARMAPVLVVVLVVELVALRLWFRRDLDRAQVEPPGGVEHETAPPVPVVPVVVVAAMLVGFALGSPAGIDPAWVAGAGAVVLGAWALRRGLLGPRDVADAAHPSFALFVLALGVVVAAISSGYLADLVSPLLPDDAPGALSFGPRFVSLLVVAVVATVVANLITNLSATLLLVPLVAPLGDTAVLAVLIGLNVGSGLTYSGSLANLLWRRGLADRGEDVSMGAFHRYSLVVTPPVLLAAVAALALTT